MSSIYKESDGFISSANCYEIDDGMSMTSIEKRTLFGYEITDGRKKTLNKILIKSDLELLGKWQRYNEKNKNFQD